MSKLKRLWTGTRDGLALGGLWLAYRVYAAGAIPGKCLDTNSIVCGLGWSAFTLAEAAAVALVVTVVAWGVRRLTTREAEMEGSVADE